MGSCLLGKYDTYAGEAGLCECSTLARVLYMHFFLKLCSELILWRMQPKWRENECIALNEVLPKAMKCGRCYSREE